MTEQRNSVPEGIPDHKFAVTPPIAPPAEVNSGKSPELDAQFRAALATTIADHAEALKRLAK